MEYIVKSTADGGIMISLLLQSKTEVATFYARFNNNDEDVLGECQDMPDLGPVDPDCDEGFYDRLTEVVCDMVEDGLL